MKAPAKLHPPTQAPRQTFLVDQQPLEATVGSICIAVHVQSDELPAGLSVGTSSEDSMPLVDSKCRVTLPRSFDSSLETVTLRFFSADGEQLAEMQVSTLDGDYRVQTIEVDSGLTVLAETTRL